VFLAPEKTVMAFPCALKAACQKSVTVVTGKAFVMAMETPITGITDWLITQL
jgi:hypothetical protein